MPASEEQQRLPGLTPPAYTAGGTVSDLHRLLTLSARQPPPDATARQPPPDATARQPPPDATARQPPPDATARQPPPDATARQSPPDATARQPLPPLVYVGAGLGAMNGRLYTHLYPRYVAAAGLCGRRTGSCERPAVHTPLPQVCSRRWSMWAPDWEL